jgi:hypothetical protein
MTILQLLKDIQILQYQLSYLKITLKLKDYLVPIMIQVHILKHIQLLFIPLFNWVFFIISFALYSTDSKKIIIKVEIKS